RGDTPSKNAQLSLPSYGRVTGLAFAGTAMFGVSDQGDLYRIGGAAFNPDSANNNGDFIETIYNTTTGQRVQFSSLVAGPRNAESSLQFTTLDTGLDQILFGIDTGGILYAFDTLGRPAHIFPDAQWFIQTSTNNPSGLAFSNLDVNLWHETGNNRDNDDGHGVNVAFDGSRRTQENGGNSLYFGFENPNDANRQPGNWAGVNNPIGGFPGYDAARENTYDFPGGAKGSVISDPINLSNYSPADKPYLYFNYYLQTENANANNPGDSNFMKDAFRVFASEPNGTWRLLATNNSDYDASRLTGQRDEFDYPFEEDIPRALAGLPLQALNRQVSELFDAGAAFNGQTAPNNWRQARIDLSRFAGQKDLRLRFDFSTAGSAVIAQGGTELVAIAGSEMPLSAAQRRFTISGTPNVQFEFDFGLLLQVPSGGRITNGDQFQVDGITFTFSLLNNTGNNVLFAATESAETIAARIAAKLTPTGLNAVIDPVTPSLISISNATNSNPIVSPTLPASFIADVPGVAAGNEPIVISRGMTAAQVRDEIRKAFARRLNAAGQETNVNAVRFNGNSIYLWNRTVVNRGPLLNPPTLQGDEFGERNS
ncbi:MAG: hypothetical protein KGQ60_17125, partial [Planctomycetes bacterium]|nr:hypothetical protein [Planctomycetota bacterium]